MAVEKGTKLLHLTYEGNFQLETDATVLACRVVDDAIDDAIDDAREEGRTVRVELQLDVTAMHPQGGGQPTDIGTITARTDGDGAPACVATIDKVTLDRATGVVTHAGAVAVPRGGTPDPFPAGTVVRVRVDAARRRMLSECHTAGHLVDATVARCATPFPATKGYHFLEGPYVEFKGAIETKERDTFLGRLKVAYQELIDQDLPTGIQTLPLDEADALCNRRAQNFDASNFTSPEDPNPTVRVVTVADGAVHAVMCGGTHVQSTGALRERGWGVRGLKCKKGVVRVRYGPTEQ